MYLSARQVLILGALAMSFAPCLGVRLAPSQPNICGTNATVYKWVVNAVNLTDPRMQTVARYVSNNNANGACEALADYYSNCSSGAWLRHPTPPPSSKRAGGAADRALNDTFELNGVGIAALHVPRLPDGRLDWYYTGPRHDPEAMNCINRHEYIAAQLLGAYLQTGNSIYAAKAADLVADWVLSLPCTNGCRTSSAESPWRTLEQGIRMAGPWPQVFYGLQGAPRDAFNTTARVLMLFGVSEHGVTLARDGQAGAPNWRMQQYTGLVTLALAFPELSHSAEWLATALEGIEREIDDEVYPDGVETEMATGYDIASALNFYSVLTTVKAAGSKSPTSLHDKVETMFEYAAYATDQWGYSPRAGDADVSQPWSSSALQSTAQFFNRSDWTYVVTGGRQGQAPVNRTSPSTLFPWAGQVMFRSGWTQDPGQWALFDIGPYGSSGHAHRDRLHLNVRANNSFILVDSGRFAYNGDNATWHSQYAPTTRAHNTLTFDNLNQLAEPAVASQPVPSNHVQLTDTIDVAVGSMSLWDRLQGTANHSRLVHYNRSASAYVVVDVADSDRPRTVQATWHSHPQGDLVATTGNAVAESLLVTGYPNPMKLSIVRAQAASLKWTGFSIVSGEKPPEFPNYQGWYSSNYTDCRPAKVAVYNASIPAGRSVAAWLLVVGTTSEPAASTLTMVSADPGDVVLEAKVGEGVFTVHASV